MVGDWIIFFLQKSRSIDTFDQDRLKSIEKGAANAAGDWGPCCRRKAGLLMQLSTSFRRAELPPALLELPAALPKGNSIWGNSERERERD